VAVAVSAAVAAAAAWALAALASVLAALEAGHLAVFWTHGTHTVIVSMQASSHRGCMSSTPHTRMPGYLHSFWQVAHRHLWHTLHAIESSCTRCSAFHGTYAGNSSMMPSPGRGGGSADDLMPKNVMSGRSVPLRSAEMQPLQVYDTLYGEDEYAVVAVVEVPCSCSSTTPSINGVVADALFEFLFSALDVVLNTPSLSQISPRNQYLLGRSITVQGLLGGDRRIS